MFSSPYDSLEQRADLMELFDRHFDGVSDHVGPQKPVPVLADDFPADPDLRAPIARMRPRRQVVKVRGGRVCARRLRH